MGTVAILMPVRNAMPECLESIRDQTYRKWTLYAVDDHSTDQSLLTLQQFAEKDKRIKVMQNAGKGIISALRRAYAESAGILIHRMDADDLMPEDKLHKLVEAWQKHGKGSVITGKVKYFAKSGVSDGYRKYENWLNELVNQDIHWQHIYKECVIPSPCWLLHREDLNACGAFEPDRYPEDYDLVFRMYEQQLKVIGIKKVLHLWRDHPRRSSRNHEHYQANFFFRIKLHYFFKLNRDRSRKLYIWGAGPKGKLMAKLLKELNEPFTWVSNNPNKQGKEIYEKTLHSYKMILQTEKPQVIVTVAQRNARREIEHFLGSCDLKESVDYYFFR